MAKIKKKKLSKKTNRKKNFKKFIDSEYTDYQAFLMACKNDENLLIYTCLNREELTEYINEMKKIDDVDEQIKFLVNNQPTMNKDLKRFNKVVESIACYLKGYIEYNGFRMANSDGDNEDWTSEFWAKYCKICDFYRTRWFFPEKLNKPTSVVYSPMLYKEFIYICRMSITGERKHRAFLATQNQNSSIFKMSLDNKIDSSNEADKTLSDIIPDTEKDVDYLIDLVNVNKILDKALNICKEYPDSNKYYDKIKDFYSKQDPVGFDKKIVVLGKIFLYKAGLVSPKILNFIKTLSTTYKARYNISSARVNKQMLKFKNEIKTSKQRKVDVNTKDLSWKELLFRKRGEL